MMYDRDFLILFRDSCREKPKGLELINLDLIHDGPPQSMTRIVGGTYKQNRGDRGDRGVCVASGVCTWGGVVDVGLHTCRLVVGGAPNLRRSYISHLLRRYDCGEKEFGVG